jgi:hypothetical protein
MVKSVDLVTIFIGACEISLTYISCFQPACTRHAGRLKCNLLSAWHVHCELLNLFYSQSHTVLCTWIASLRALTSMILYSVLLAQRINGPCIYYKGNASKIRHSFIFSPRHVLSTTLRNFCRLTHLPLSS